MSIRIGDRAGGALGVLRSASPAAIEIFASILTTGPVSRTDVARATGLSQAAVTKAVAPMITAGLIVDHDEPDRQEPLRGAPRGRPASPIRVDSDALVVLGIKVNPGEIIGAATNLTAEVLETVHQPVERDFATVLEVYSKSQAAAK